MSSTEEATVTEEGTVTIPEEVRDRLGLEAGDAVSFAVEGDVTVTLRKAGDPMDQLPSVQERLALMEVDVERLQREADEQWRTFE
jgi:AbrB family looped-hinge helix DNA binding protein